MVHNLSTTSQSLVRMNEYIENLSDNRQKTQLSVFRDHVVAEFDRDVDAVMKTMSHGPISYKRDGNAFMRIAELSSITHRDDVRKMYSRVVETGGTLAGPTDGESFFFGPEGLVERFIGTGIFSGALLTGYDAAIDRGAHFLVRWRHVLAITFDENGLISGEDGFAGAPILVRKVDKGMIGLLRDGPLPAEWR